MKSEQNYFTWDNYLKIFGIDQYIKFADELVGKYRSRWSNAVYNDLKRKLKLIDLKQRDSKLNISIVGDFSTGKSTFINALLRCELLKENIIQGTTTAITILEYSSHYEMEVQYKQSNSKKYKYEDLEHLRTSVYRFTASDEAKDIDVVKIGIPALILNSGIRIIDTPGTDSLEAWHSETTARALREFSDLSVIVVDITKPLPKKFCDFIRDNLQDILGQCVFLLTKYDMAQSRERKKLSKFIDSKLKIEFNLENPNVLPFASLEVLRAFADGADASARESELVTLSLKSEKNLVAFAAEQRGIVQAKKLFTLVDTIYGELSSYVNNLNANLYQELAFLNNSKSADLGSFIAEQKQERASSLKFSMESVYNNIFNLMHDQQQKAIESIKSDINQLGDLDSVKSYVESRLSQRCSQEAQEIVSKMDGVDSSLKSCFIKEINNFQSAFKQQFENLNILSMQFEPAYSVNFNLDKVGSVSIKSASSYINSELQDQNKEKWGGAAIGAGIGFMVLGPLGGVVGGLLGSAFSGGRDMSVIRQNTCSKVSPVVSNYLQEVVDCSSKSLKKCTLRAKESLNKEIDNYYNTYRLHVEQQLDEWNKKKLTINRQIVDIKTDAETLDGNRVKMKSVAERLMSRQIIKTAADLSAAEKTSNVDSFRKHMPGNGLFIASEKLRLNCQFDKAVEGYTRAAKLGHAGAFYWLGNCFEYGCGVAQDNDQALSYYREAALKALEFAENNLSDALYFVGRCYETGCGLVRDINQAILWYKRSADLGYDEAEKALRRLT